MLRLTRIRSGARSRNWTGSVRRIHEEGSNKEIPKQSKFKAFTGKVSSAVSTVKSAGSTILFLGTVYVVYKIVSGFRNQSMTLKEKSRLPKYVLEVTKLEDKLASYNESFLEVQGGERAIKMLKSRDQLRKEVHLPENSIDIESLQVLMHLGEQIKKLSDSAIVERKQFRQRVLQAALEGNKKREQEKRKRVLQVALEENKKREQEKEKAKNSTKDQAADKEKQQQQELVEKKTDEAEPYLDGIAQDLLDPVCSSEISSDPMMKALAEQIRVEMVALRIVVDLISPEFRERLAAGDVGAVSTVMLLKDSMLGLNAPGSDAALLDNSREGLFFDQGLYSSLIAGLPLRRKVFVLRFKGDIRASQVAKLREEVTAVLGQANQERGDSVVVQLDSGGGTVTGYGLGASQLARIKAAGLKLTVCVDEVAASGGYMMAAVADRIIASPFAVLGSIGVVSTMPNFSERMHKEGFSVEEITAGKHKRTLTPYKTPTSTDREKVQQELEDILRQFKAHLTMHRPCLDANKLATGETWLGSEALQRGMVDELGTADDYLLKLLREENCEVFFLRLKKRPPNTLAEIFEAEKNDGEDDDPGPAGVLVSAIATGIVQAVGAWVLNNIGSLGDGSVTDSDALLRAASGSLGSFGTNSGSRYGGRSATDRYKNSMQHQSTAFQSHQLKRYDPESYVVGGSMGIGTQDQD